MAKTIAICNQKGGVTKTTTTLNLGVGLAREASYNYSPEPLLMVAEEKAELSEELKED